MDNPLGQWQVGRMEPGLSFPVPMLIQAAITGSVDDGIPDHAEDACAALAERGTAAWQEAAAVLAAYLVANGQFGEGEQAAQRYTEAQPAQVWQVPALAAMHRTVAACLRGGQEAAAAELNGDAAAAEGAARVLLGAIIEGAGYPAEKAEALQTRIVGPALNPQR